MGTGRLGLALTEEYLKELKFVQDMIGFSYIRGHGLFSDDVAIFQEYEEDGVKKVEYNYTYIDRIFDRFLEVGIRPYLELGFMPEKLASGTQTIFYWKGNTTPPKDYKMWTDMVIALLEHLKGRYGDEVASWPIEVWNEPNLPGFWYKADMEEYFKLFSDASGIPIANISVLAYDQPNFIARTETERNLSLLFEILLAVLIIGLLLFVVFRAMKPEEIIETEPELSVERLLATTKENQRLEDIEFGEKSETRRLIEKYIDENPDSVAALLRNWLNDDGWE